ncbi:hypothetical protein SMACR_12719 [Sordaria macrospora]|uniref:WGS project CABT00000000 data, contig 2.105 n=2 Tax=Sordaria macrospora TaxID=5147 RepID=F7WC96_SORMK|nr:uncharacterized protein SMAC_12719 [Sordaria macrospora k-hell]KAA8624145.1 hypothetical protein SMACR_12719 [Sordaria macrospora]KAH7628908.1 hypothetical protein B0T09DRAFT_267481 [Sordaria sp. MPI-SDFR-AT-0083]CCC05569.1 unnamed protein product [Sordaria macrospora k-hell]
MPPSTGTCQDPTKCELSPEISNALERFSLPHNCKFAQAKRQLVDKIVSDIMNDKSSSITTVLQDELRKWENENRGKR